MQTQVESSLQIHLTNDFGVPGSFPAVELPEESQDIQFMPLEEEICNARMDAKPQK